MCEFFDPYWWIRQSGSADLYVSTYNWHQVITAELGRLGHLTLIPSYFLWGYLIAYCLHLKVALQVLMVFHKISRFALKCEKILWFTWLINIILYISHAKNIYLLVYKSHIWFEFLNTKSVIIKQDSLNYCVLSSK